jgi:hypothetical protein
MIIEIFAQQKTCAVLGALLWLTMMLRVAPDYIGAFDPQLLAHVFSLLALFCYVQWKDNLNFPKVLIVALLCTIAIFTKHLVVVVPMSIAVTYLFENKRTCFTFLLALCITCAFFLLAVVLYGGENAWGNFIDFIRPTLNKKMWNTISFLFIDRGLYVLVFPFVVLLLFFKTRFLIFTSYFFLSLLLGIYTSRGVGVDKNAWFDFFISASLVFGLCVSMIFYPSEMIDRTTDRYKHVIVKLSVKWPLFAAAVICLVLLTAINNLFIAKFSVMKSIRLVCLSGVKITELFCIVSFAVIVVWRLLSSTAHKVKPKFLTHNVNMHLLAISLLFPVTIASLIVPLSKNVQGYLRNSTDYANLQIKNKLYREDVLFLKSIPGPALFNDLLLGFDAGKDFLFDPFNGSQLMASGRIPENMITDPIEKKVFGAIILSFNVEKKYHQKMINKDYVFPPSTTIFEQWTDNTLRAISKHYELVNRPSNFYFYLPRPHT